MSRISIVLAGGVIMAGLAIYMLVKVPRSEPGEGAPGPGREEGKVSRPAHGPGRAERQERREELGRIVRQHTRTEGSAHPRGAAGAAGRPVSAPGGTLAPGGAVSRSGAPGSETGETKETGEAAAALEPGIRGWLKARNQAPTTAKARQTRLTMLRARVAHIPGEIKAAREQLARQHKLGEMPMDEEDNIRQGIKNMEDALDRARKDLAKLESEGGSEAPTPVPTP